MHIFYEPVSQSRRMIGMSGSRFKDQPSEVSRALRRCLPAFVGVAAFSSIINFLMLTGSVYMLQVYDRVLASRSVSTLVGISLIVLAAYLLQGALEGLRSQMLSRIGARFDELLSPRVYELAAGLPLMGARPAEALQPIRDLDQIRAFLSGLGPTALLDLPFLPVFVAGCFLLHPWLGWLSVGGGMIIIFLTLLTEVRTRAPAKAMTATAAERHTLAETTRRNAEALKALGMREALAGRFAAANTRLVADGLQASDAAGRIGAAAKVFRMVLQSGALGLGAYLVIRNELSPGSMIAASILLSRALAPIEVAVAHWKGFVAARQGYARLRGTLALMPAEPARLALPAPCRSLSVTDAVVAAPGRSKPILQGVSLRLEAGHALGVIGPSASGKSTLARALVGVWPTLKGQVRLDGAALDHYGTSSLGQHVGYLPQDVELFEGTVAENIARFDRDADPDAVIAAAQAAGAHEMILGLPQAYDTPIGEGGAVLSGGQRQRVALARALYREPFLVVLDEPNANLDGAGDEALNGAIRAVRQRGGIAVVVTHRPTGLAAVDQVAIMAEGRIQALGPREEVLQSLMRRSGMPSVRTPEPLREGAQ